ncbi:hypothetical protein KKH23_02285 [Patescibacteria group bacterium]|nr:hypothetical protein [Patescibacteria group bacterium]MBU0776675.1 hypothetical protein [Patescibacteria group bacterium]MBU0846005.1 hypothetical protein [Patescibacteria group bacterium]MBU0922495.1 hypothetical protein [Patescibacteria group bacterium]MBU1066772.1 hypothetical protein [Patescibacteria group bacterium]
MDRLKERKTNLTGDEVDKVIELCFRAMEELENPLDQCRAAVILSGIVQKGLGSRTKEFLDEHAELPERVHEILGSSILRMETF